MNGSLLRAVAGAQNSCVRVWARGAVGITAALGLLVIVGLAVYADDWAGIGRWLGVLDVAVGLAFVAVGLAAGGSRRQRLLVGLVGPAWLVGSFAPGARSAHQAVLVWALLAFPAGHIRGLVRWVVAVLAVPAGLHLFAQVGVAAVFVGVALAVMVDWRREGLSARYPVAAGAGMAVVLAASWAVARLWPAVFHPVPALVMYEAALLVVAGAFPAAVRGLARGRARLADRLVADERLVGLTGLATVLGGVLGDAGLRVFRWRSEAGCFVDVEGRTSAGGGGGWLGFEDDDGPVAGVLSGSPALADPHIAAAVGAAVRLAVTNLRLLEEQQERVAEVEASRARLIAAADRQRERVAAELRETVDAPLAAAQTELTAARPGPLDGEILAALEVVVGELAAARREIAGLVAGVPPARLGGGRLVEAVRVVARMSPVPVTVIVEGGADGDRAAETALFYVICEALANVGKHAGASSARVALHGRSGALVAVVSDDGAGGADPAGSGLRGLADRLAVHGGRVRVDSPPGAGTAVTATVPRGIRRSFAKA